MMHAYVPDYAVPPGETIAETATARGLSDRAIQRLLGLDAVAWQDLLAGARIIDVPLAQRLASILGPPAAFWLNLEQQYRHYPGVGATKEGHAMSNNDLRLIEKGFPCHQVGAETQREQSVGSQPATHRLHVWWARRPLTPSRAAIHASLLPANTDVDDFLMTLGVKRRVVEIEGNLWVLPKNILGDVEEIGSALQVEVTAKFIRALTKENESRAKNRELLAQHIAEDPAVASDPVVVKWLAQSDPLAESACPIGEAIEVKEITADPAYGNARIAWEDAHGIRTADDKYGYDRAFSQAGCATTPDPKVILDPTSGGGSIPFEALRLGHKVIANELNPVATTILHATLDYPARFGERLSEPLREWGKRLRQRLVDRVGHFFPSPPVDGDELAYFKRTHKAHPDLIDKYLTTTPDGYLYVRTVTCPHCRGEAPLFNALWLSKAAGDLWAVRPVAENKKVRFEPYRIEGTLSKEDRAALDAGTCTRGTGQCIHCRQAIDGDEIKAQARGESPLGKWRDVLYSVVSVRYEPKLKANGSIDRYASGAKKGEIKTKKVRYFRGPTATDLQALDDSRAELMLRWAEWERKALIPTGKRSIGAADRIHNYGISHFHEMFTPRQLLNHITITEELLSMKSGILSQLGNEKGKAVITYLQFAIDKAIDYNSAQTRWIPQRACVSGTFGRHDFSLKWTFGEPVNVGEASGFAWALGQVIDAYNEICSFTSGLSSNPGNPRIEIVNGSATNMSAVASESVDLVVMDPPYYDNVMYAELSDFYYVWQKRTLGDLYPTLYSRAVVNKAMEAIADPIREGGSSDAKEKYEGLMEGIFSECRRVLKSDGIFTMMFTHKSQDAWETLTRSLIESGWTITSSTPVESENQNSTHVHNKAAAASSIFLTCRKREATSGPPTTWTGIGGQGVARQIRAGVAEGLKEFASLHLNPVDEMVASYGRALKVLSEHWPVLDENNEPVSPVRAMNEASSVVAHHHIAKVTQGRLSVDDLSPEAAMAVTIFGIYRCGHLPYHEGLNLSRSLGIDLASRPGAYKADDRFIGIAQEAGGRGKRARGTDEGYHAPLLRNGSKLRLAFPEERHAKRIDSPQTEWDILHGLILAYTEGEAPQARAYLAKHAEINPHRIVDLLQVYACEIGDRDREKTAKAMLFDLKGG